MLPEDVTFEVGLQKERMCWAVGTELGLEGFQVGSDMITLAF